MELASVFSLLPTIFPSLLSSADLTLLSGVAERRDLESGVILRSGVLLREPEAENFAINSDTEPFRLGTSGVPCLSKSLSPTPPALDFPSSALGQLLTVSTGSAVVGDPTNCLFTDSKAGLGDEGRGGGGWVPALTYCCLPPSAADRPHSAPSLLPPATGGPDCGVS